METADHLLAGLGAALTFQNLSFALIGSLLGTAIGVLPGIGPIAGTAILMPLTFKLDADRRHHHAVRRSITARCMAARSPPC